jgi:uncharacterized membrane protein
MAEDYGETLTLEDEIEDSTKKKNNKTLWIILAIVAVVLLCCCVVSVIILVWMWNTGGDLILENLGWSLLAPVYYI